MYVVAALLVMLLLVAIFVSQNVHLVEVNVLAWQLSWPLGVIILASTAAGAVLVALLGLVRHVGMSFRMYDARGRLRRTENELDAARTELEKAKAALAERAQDLAVTREALAAVRRELEEARRQAGAGAGGSDDTRPDPS
ncbi:MAG: lipopolysaccharide assembly protein LapA domain-containing protein [Bacillota bacterium]